MAKFVIGQRVRIVKTRTVKWHHLVGKPAVITEIQGSGYGLDISPIEYDPTDGRFWVWNSYQLEPLVPEGHKPAELTVEELLPFLKTREVV